MHGRLAEFACRHSFHVECGHASAAGPGWKAFPMPGAPTRWSRDRKFDVVHVRIELDVDPVKKRIDGTVVHTIRPFADGLSAAEFDIAELDVSRVTAGGKACKFHVEGGKLSI